MEVEHVGRDRRGIFYRNVPRARHSALHFTCTDPFDPPSKAEAETTTICISLPVKPKHCEVAPLAPAHSKEGGAL